MIRAFKFRAQAMFSLFEKIPPGSQNLSSGNIFNYSILEVPK
jgi:hypothetical protein